MNNAESASYYTTRGAEKADTRDEGAEGTEAIEGNDGVEISARSPDVR